MVHKNESERSTKCPDICKILWNNQKKSNSICKASEEFRKKRRRTLFDQVNHLKNRNSGKDLGGIELCESFKEAKLEYVNAECFIRKSGTKSLVMLSSYVAPNELPFGFGVRGVRVCAQSNNIAFSKTISNRY